jgi:hypothetical protein
MRQMAQCDSLNSCHTRATFTAIPGETSVMRITGVLLFYGLMAQACAAEVVAWERTPEVFSGKYVIVKLAGGTRIEGSWASVTSDSFRMRVERTTNSKAFPKGLQTVPRRSMATLRAGKRRVRGRVIGIIAGWVGAIEIGGAVSQGPDNPVLPVAGLGAAVAGYYIGKNWDHATTEFVIAP